LISPMWGDTPRAFGNPGQFLVYDIDYLRQLIDENNGNCPIYISHNSFPKIDRFGSPETVMVSKVLKDLDNEKKPENALLDLRLLVRFAQKHNIPHCGSFSGSKGFHFFHLLEPEEYPADRNLEEAVRAVQLWWRGLGKWDGKKYDNLLRTDDDQVVGDWRRLIRVWGSKYSKYNPKTRTSTPKDTHCIPLTDDMILNMSMPDIIEFSKTPTPVQLDYSGDAYTLQEFIKAFDIKKPEYDTPMYNIGNGKIVDFTDREDKIMRKMFPDDCLYNQIMSDNPTHMGRFALVVYCKETLAMSEGQVFNLFQSRKWVDNHNKNVCEYQINQIYRKNYGRPKNRLKFCMWMRRRSLCVGNKCDKFDNYVKHWEKESGGIQ